MFKFKKSLGNINRSSNNEDRSKYKFRLDRNEKIFPFKDQDKNKFNKYLNSIDLNLYPNLEKSYKKLSKLLRIDRKNILITEGVSGAIKNILDSTEINRNTEIVVPNPSFALYKIYSKIYDLKLKTYNYDNKFNLKLNDIFKIISKNTSIVFLTFPNIPVEGSTDLKFIKRLANFLKKKKILLVIDEVYFPFNKSSALNLVKRFKNLVVMKSFSKAFGLAGARIGYMVSEENRIKIFSNTKGGYETNMLSAMAMNFVIDNHNLTKKYVKDVANGFIFLKKKLVDLKIDYHGGNNSNFIFINFDNEITAKKIFKKLKQNKVAVRYGYPKPFNKGILVTGCPLNEMKKFFFIFKKIYK